MSSPKQHPIEVLSSDLPLHCPQSQEVWNLHPRVFLDLEKTGQAICPYCGQSYILNSTTNDTD
ncbi:MULTISPECIES: zinc-finger domain-containing protein [Candidatus Ichthyocystis]|uniref:Putative zinc-finger domain protein n=1 Tax=Candidatus Ichthyocystis hellenicum TaxID=1561003 RepID=A0A0S4M2H5_9BURK|nr:MULTISPECIES: zinc-finger domain-containing protein [Ichthyocystis]CUT16954.1 putative zinc-finger domain protein [Candidatus Ichthyocystis hellenicum]